MCVCGGGGGGSVCDRCVWESVCVRTDRKTGQRATNFGLISESMRAKKRERGERERDSM